MKKLKSCKTEYASARITKELSEAINEYAKRNEEKSRATAIEKLLIKALNK
ncbi:hypothetical protein [Priestia megaterium]|uniref:hypothetical protein n=1 Tax=Priestia megaterium TaxID=1404 RepID=UPI002E209811|nr:hypothetical protein [Priestia megaterium]MED4278297.1 hypothetical protein [Priestia megaterium]MED4314402.1 hypothetical protein [Priestia megaterium]